MAALKRPLHEIPPYITEALESEGLTESYWARPPYQRNDYIGWITRAKLQETIDKRLNQMLDELKDGTRYMGMKYNARK
ncbi:MAG: YdeI/OmpD-associated family protein [Deltaproteobacteria bacterium]